MKKVILMIALMTSSLVLKAQVTDTGGNVGIGTTSPSTILHVASSAPVVKIQNSNEEGTSDSFHGWIGGYDKNGAEMWWLGEGSTSSKQLGFFTSRVGYDLKIFNQGSGLTVKGNGAVGIGTTIPNAKLDVNGNINFASSQGVWLTGKTDTGGINSSTQLKTGHYQSLIRQKTASDHVVNLGGIGDVFGFFGFDKNRTSNGIDHSLIMNIDNGFVGIGTVTPTAKLDVNGNINFASSQGVWLTGKTDTGGINSSTQLKTGHYQSLIRQKTASDHVVNIGGIGDVFGFFGFDKNRTSNGVDHSLVMNTNNGNVGIGTVSPNAKLQINDTGLSSVTTFQLNNRFKFRGDGVMTWGLNSDYGILSWDSGRTIMGAREGKDLVLLASGNEKLRVLQNGNVGIGTTTIPTGYKLAIAGKTITEEVKVQLKVNWPDYVFDKAYDLPTLKEVEKHIEEKGHLPNIPSAKEVKENKGIELGKMNAKLLEKIEELTLYTIQQEKEIQELKKQERVVEKLSKEMEILRNENKQLKNLAKEIALIKAKLK
ncbi:hypothetical protein [uncultured Tenacibaculum sp.]|uniref:hypothetical protein n=1 Tax=uncultured Tenacibaculum sp. TaxID=174713 RepID=UPI0026260EF5|nr:hypothetical protein [uncultured Tenacibaculum sp.]